MSTLPETASVVATNQMKAIDRILASFEQAWKNGASPQLENYWQESPQDVRAELFEALLRIELKWRCQRGKTPQLQEYVTRFPDKKAVVTSMFAQVTDQGATQTSVGEWYYLRNGKPVGPFQFHQLQKLAQGGDLRPKDKVSQKGTVGWVEAGSVAGLFGGPRPSGELKQPTAGQWIREDYVLLEMVGRGGMGEIYKAYRFSLKKEVALKIIRFDRFHQLAPANQHQVLDGFRNEMQATAKLAHEHIVTIHDTGDLNGLPFYTMDFSESSLAQQLHTGPLPGVRAADHMEKVARAVEFAHQHHIIHRDIKPHNILLMAGKPVLADLGLAAVQDKLFERQNVEEVAGSPAYMAPEQARGQQTDYRTDVYGMGATLYHLLTGRPPHQAPLRAQTLAQVLEAEPVPPRKLNAAIDRDLEAITLKCLEKDPEKRYQTAAELADDLERFRQGKPVSAKRPPLWQRLHKWARREPIKAGLVACLLLVLLIYYLNSVVHSRNLAGALQQAEQARDEATRNAEEAANHAKVAANHAKVAERKGEEAEKQRQRANDLGNILVTFSLRKFMKQQDPNSGISDLTKHIAMAEDLLKKNPTSDEIKFDLADTYDSLCTLHVQSPESKWPEAAAALQKCIDYQEQLCHKYPLLMLNVALNYLDLGSFFGVIGDRDGQVASDNKALKSLTELRDKGYDKIPALFAALGQVQLILGQDYLNIKGEPAKAQVHLTEAVRILEKLSNDTEKGNPSYVSYQNRLASAYQQVGIGLVRPLRPNPQEITTALGYFDKAIKIYAGKSQYRTNLAEVNRSQARAFRKSNEPEKALAAVKAGMELAALVRQDLPEKSQQTEPVLRLQARLLSDQALIYQDQRDYARAEELFKESLTILLTLSDKSMTAKVDNYLELAQCHEKQQKMREALEYIGLAISLQEAYIAKAPKDFTRKRMAGFLRYEQGRFFFNDKKFDKALDSFSQAKEHESEAYKKNQGADYSANLYYTCLSIFNTQVELRNFKGALESIQERIQLSPPSFDKHADAVRDLLTVYKHDRIHVPTIVALLDEAFTRKHLEVAKMKANPLFNELLFEQPIRQVIAKHEKT